MLIRHEAIFIPPGSTTSKLQNPLQVPWKFTLLNETKLRENATNNPGQRCTCSKHGLSLAGMSVPGDLGQQILKTMLRRYEALGGAVALPLSKRVAGLLSMVFYAKAGNPQELVAIEMGNQA